MSDLERVLERVVEDPTFADWLRRDPNAALADYALSADDRAVLGAPAGNDPGALEGVEDRLNKAALTGLVSSVIEVLGHAGSGHAGAGHAGAGHDDVSHSASGHDATHGGFNAAHDGGARAVHAAPGLPPPSVGAGLDHAQQTLTEMAAHGHQVDDAVAAAGASEDVAADMTRMQELMHGMLEQAPPDGG